MYRDAADILCLVGGVLPGLGEHAIVPVDVVGVVPQLPLLRVLLYGSQLLVLRAHRLPHYSRAPTVKVEIFVSLLQGITNAGWPKLLKAVQLL